MNRILPGLVTFAALFLTTASAATVFCYDQTAGPNGVGGNTLQDYINLGSGGCVMNNLVFNNFSYSYMLGVDSYYVSGPKGTGAPQTAGNVGVVVTQGSNSFQFNGSWTVDHFQTASLNLAFTVAAPAAQITLLQNAFTGGASGIENGGSKTVECATTGTFTPGSPDPADPNATCSPTAFTNSSLGIPGTNGPITITNHAEMNANGNTLGFSNTDHISVIEDQFSASSAPSVPEPVTAGLAGLGIGLLAFLRRRR
jgi:MYXO-CTERM domain-containing protein